MLVNLFSVVCLFVCATTVSGDYELLCNDVSGGNTTHGPHINAHTKFIGLDGGVCEKFIPVYEEKAGCTDIGFEVQACTINEKNEGPTYTVHPNLKGVTVSQIQPCDSSVWGGITVYCEMVIGPDVLLPRSHY